MDSAGPDDLDRPSRISVEAATLEAWLDALSDPARAAEVPAARRGLRAHFASARAAEYAAGVARGMAQARAVVGAYLAAVGAGAPRVALTRLAAALASSDLGLTAREVAPLVALLGLPVASADDSEI